MCAELAADEDVRTSTMLTILQGLGSLYLIHGATGRLSHASVEWPIYNDRNRQQKEC